jgi:hypothetical protein
MNKKMDVVGFISNQLGNNGSVTYTRDYLGAVQLLDNSGFSPYSDISPLDSSLQQIFNRFVRKTGLGTHANALKDEFLEQYPATRQAIDLYGALENTFSAWGSGEKAAIVDFLNSRIDDFITQTDTDDTLDLTFEESGLTASLFQSLDANSDDTIDAAEIQDSFYNDFQQLNSVLNYFQNTPGSLIDMFA